jgi:hypothetical protein
LRLKFTGSVQCRQSAGVPGVTLVGRTEAGDQAYLSLIARVPPEVPAQIESPEVERVDAEHHRICAGALTFTLEAAQSYLHRDVSGAFYQALRPRPVPLARRVLWRLVLAAARTRIAAWWLGRSAR